MECAVCMCGGGGVHTYIIVMHAEQGYSIIMHNCKTGYNSYIAWLLNIISPALASTCGRSRDEPEGVP